MANDAFRNFVYRRLGSRAFLLLRRLVIFGRYLGGKSYDPDYAFVRSLPRGSLIIDVGANAGQSALEFLRLKPDAHVISFEPNPDSAFDLDLVANVLGARFEWYPYALSDHDGVATLHVPILGRTPIPAEATLEPEYLTEIEGRVGCLTSTVRYCVKLRTLDSFQLSPKLIKLDAQGHEVLVLRGMSGTLKMHKPILLIELGKNFEELSTLLREFGYRTFQYDREEDRLIHTKKPVSGSFYALSA